jgi:hypothetical protein
MLLHARLSASMCELAKTGNVRIKRSGKRIDHYEGCDPGEDADFLSHFPSQCEGIAIADARREGSRVRAIAREIGRSPSTVSREITRNSHPINGNYSPHAAQEGARTRKPRMVRQSCLVLSFLNP